METSFHWLLVGKKPTQKNLLQIKKKKNPVVYWSNLTKKYINALIVKNINIYNLIKSLQCRSGEKSSGVVLTA